MLATGADLDRPVWVQGMIGIEGDALLAKSLVSPARIWQHIAIFVEGTSPVHPTQGSRSLLRTGSAGYSGLSERLSGTRSDAFLDERSRLSSAPTQPGPSRSRRRDT